MRRRALLACGSCRVDGYGRDCACGARNKGVQVVADEAKRRVDITIDGQPFTSYIWPTTLKKPVLYPIVDADGVTVTRGCPLEPRPASGRPSASRWPVVQLRQRERLRFLEQLRSHSGSARRKMGTIVFDKIVSTKSGATRGELVPIRRGSTGRIIPSCRKPRRYVFAHSGPDAEHRSDRHAEGSRPCRLQRRQGRLARHARRALARIAGRKGRNLHRCERHRHDRCSGCESARCAPPTGEYLTSEGVQGEAAWSTRGRWCSLTGHDDADTRSTIAIFDHPGNIGYPTYWHARGYGLFAANPLGRHMFDPKQPPLNYTLEKGQTATFRYRLVFYTHAATADELNREADAFAAENK